MADEQQPAAETGSDAQPVAPVPTDVTTAAADESPKAEASKSETSSGGNNQPALASFEKAPKGFTTIDPLTEAETDFDGWDLAEPVRRALADMGYERPTLVQSSVFGHLTQGQDLMVQSKTGSGKTAAFGIPIAQLLSDEKKGVQAIILAPTRELALQVAREIEKLCQHMDVQVCPIYGGAPINPQIKALEDGAQIVAGTPGRVLDHIRRGTMDTSGIRLFVLDECDEMLSMGFQEEIENILKTMPSKDQRQTLLFSATIPAAIERIGSRHMNDPAAITLSSDSVGAELIDHYYYVVSGMARTRDLLKLMKSERPDSAIIFCNTREDTNAVARFLRRNGYDAEALSSDLSQKDRERVMKRARDKTLKYLVATDIAARGIDISDLSHVINYTFPASPEVYVHRTGRTGRAGKEGTALSLVGPREIGAFYYLKLIYKIIPIERDLPSAEEMTAIEEGEKYEQVVTLVDGKPALEYRSLAKRLWQSNEGERVVAMLLQGLLTKPKDEAPARERYERIERPERSERSEEREVEASEEDDDRRRRRRRRERPERGDREEGRDRRRRRSRRRTGELDTEEELELSASEEAAVEAKRAEGAEGADEREAAAESDEAKPERKRRRRRRRNGRDEEREAAKVDESSDDELQASDAATDETSSEEPSSDEATVEAASDETDDASSATDTSVEVEIEAAAETKSDADEEDEAVEAKADEEKSDKRPARKRKRRSRSKNVRKDPGAHAEFWEAWAEDKQDNGNDDAGSSSEDEESVAAADDDEVEAKPKRKRRRRRKRSEDRDEESKDEELSADAEADADAKTTTVRLFVNIGKREDATVDSVRAFLVEQIESEGDGIGSITVRNTHCYVRVEEELAEPLIEACTGKSFGEREVVVERAKR